MRQLSEINRDIERCKQEQDATDDIITFLYYEQMLNELLSEKEHIMNITFQNT